MMNNKNLYKIIALLLIFQTGISWAQDEEKIRPRIKADYFKVMDEGSYLELSTSARIERKNREVPHLELEVFQVIDDDDNSLGKVTTSAEGKARFQLGNIIKYSPDSSSFYNFLVRFKGNDKFKRASREVSVMDAIISAKHVVIDSIDHIEGTIKDVAKDSLIEDVALEVGVRRLFKPLKMGEEFNMTDLNGTVVVPIEKGIPGIDGNLFIEVAVVDHDDYGNVMQTIEAPIGVPIVKDASYDERSLWGPRNRTPIFILVFTYGLILGILGIVVYLINNLIKIRNS
ncbi:MAG: hypothetical protein KJO49_10775 [Bacteroidia bacterium]|nr:hypothetical protein [Bacteroidia bacterium]NNK69581.1 hypothetical protein [Flavobacteriaceae bacterium]NNL80932.1 hypothetical protein [Flavobacteriaceae bacterium]